MKKILVHVHIFYPNLWEEIKECVKNIQQYPMDLYITMNEEHTDIKQDIIKNFPNAKIEIVENKGFDIGPFIHMLNEVNLNNYEYIVKLHTKKNYDECLFILNDVKLYGDKWRKLLLEPFSTSANLKKVIKLCSKKKVGMVGMSSLIVNKKTKGVIFFEDEVKNELKNIKLKYKGIKFIAGTMFIAKANLFNKLKSYKKISDFTNSTDVTNKNDTKDIAYIYERLFGALTIAQNKQIVAFDKCQKCSFINNVIYKKQKIDGALKKKIYYFLGIKVLKKIKDNNIKKIYFLGILLYKKTYNTINEEKLKQYCNWIYELKNDNSSFVGESKDNFERQQGDPKIFSYYLPQFHSIPLNDKNYGKGFTEWSNVSSAFPLYAGHYQPKIPYDVGFYSLENINVMRRQIELAKKYGIYGFCFYYYWFSGQKLLEKPIDMFLKSDIDFKFHLCWANENWSKLWDGGNKEVIMKQDDKLNANLFFQDILPYIKDKRYEKINNKPLLMIYNPSMFDKDDMKDFINKLNSLAIKEGFNGFFMMASNAFGFDNPEGYGFEGIIEFPPHGIDETNILNKNIIYHKSNVTVCNLDNYINGKKYIKNKPYIEFKTCFPSWDNSPRKAFSGGCIYDITKNDFCNWLMGILDWTKHNNPAYLNYAYINAWNEWAEGAILEPTTRYGYQNLQIVKNCLENLRLEDNND